MMRKSDNRALQHSLNQAGLYEGMIDGILGQASLEAATKYLANHKNLLPEEYPQIEERVAALFDAVETLEDEGIETTPYNNQYLYPMGTSLLCHLSYSLPQMVYVAELRAQQTVHASLRPIAQQMGVLLEENHPEMALYIDNSNDDWSEKRGEQTISEKPAA